MTKFHIYAASGFIALAIAAVTSGPAGAQNASQNVMKECGEKWQETKSKNAAGDQTWPQFLAKCRADSAQKPTAQPAVVAQAAGAKPAAPAANPAPANAVFPARVDPKYAKEKPGAARQKTCLDQYNANKATNAGAGNGGMNWIQKGGGYYSVCNKRLSGA